MPKASAVHAVLFTATLPLGVFAAELLIVPLPDDINYQHSPQGGAVQQTPDYQISEGQVILQIPDTYINTPFVLQFPDNARREIVFTKRKDGNGIISLWGRTTDSQALNTTLTVGQQNYFLTVNDYQHSETFTITGQINNGIGIYQRFDNKKYRSHIKHAAPLTNKAIIKPAN